MFARIIYRVVVRVRESQSGIGVLVDGLIGQDRSLFYPSRNRAAFGVFRSRGIPRLGEDANCYLAVSSEVITSPSVLASRTMLFACWFTVSATHSGCWVLLMPTWCSSKKGRGFAALVGGP